MSTAQHTQTDRRRRGVVVLKFSLAGAALLGIAAAATSAAWSDNAWFSAGATGATVHLDGANVTSGAAGTWSPADSSGTAAVQIPTATFSDLLPGVTNTATIGLRNSGSTTLNIGTPAIAWTGDFAAAATCDLTDASVTAVANAPTSLAANTTDTGITVTVTPPSGWADSCKGATGELTVQFNGTPTR